LATQVPCISLHQHARSRAIGKREGKNRRWHPRKRPDAEQECVSIQGQHGEGFAQAMDKRTRESAQVLSRNALLTYRCKRGMPLQTGRGRGLGEKKKKKNRAAAMTVEKRPPSSSRSRAIRKKKGGDNQPILTGRGEGGAARPIQGREKNCLSPIRGKDESCFLIWGGESKSARRYG